MLIIGGFLINFKRQREQKQVNSLFYRKKKNFPLHGRIMVKFECFFKFRV